MKTPIVAVALLTIGCGGMAHAAEPAVIPMSLISVEGTGPAIGTVTLRDTTAGMTLTPALSGLPPGLHGFHVHVNPSCAAATQPDGKMAPGMAAGGHFDPHATGKHLGPEGSGHLGDLPVLSVAGDGTATQVMIAPHLSVAQVSGRSLMIHAGGDSYSDDPKPLGGGGARIACGPIP